jgi:hypothetical protein
MKGVDVLRDKYGNRLGEIQIDGFNQVLVDRYFVRLGSYDSHDNLTRDNLPRATRRPRLRPTRPVHRADHAAMPGRQHRRERKGL